MKRRLYRGCEATFRHFIGYFGRIVRLELEEVLADSSVVSCCVGRRMIWMPWYFGSETVRVEDSRQFVGAILHMLSRCLRYSLNLIKGGFFRCHALRHQCGVYFSTRSCHIAEVDGVAGVVLGLFVVRKSWAVRALEVVT
jgi:hypothetical protein